jgi:hypothetical protein
MAASQRDRNITSTRPELAPWADRPAAIWLSFLGVTGGVQEFEGSAGNLKESSRVACVVNFYGPSDFTKSYGKSVDAAEVLPLFLGGDLAHERIKHIRASPLNWVTPDAAPTLCIHGTEDNYVAHEQAVWLIDRLKACGVEADLFTLEGAGHGFKETTRLRRSTHVRLPCRTPETPGANHSEQEITEETERLDVVIREELCDLGLLLKSNRSRNVFRSAHPPDHGNVCDARVACGDDWFERVR